MKSLKYVVTALFVALAVGAAFFLPDLYYNTGNAQRNTDGKIVNEISLADNLYIPTPYEICEALSDYSYNRISVQTDKTAEGHRQDAIKIFNNILSVADYKSDLFNTFLKQMETMEVYASEKSICTSLDQKSGDVRTFYLYHVCLMSNLGTFDILYDEQNMYAYEMSIMIDGNYEFPDADFDSTASYSMNGFDILSGSMDMYCEKYKLFPAVDYYETAEYSDHTNYFFNFRSVLNPLESDVMEQVGY